MSFRLLTLNIEKDRHLDRVRAAIATHLPDIVCLQEVMEADCPSLAEVGDYEFQYAPMARMRNGTRLRPVPDLTWGVATLARIPVREQAIACYSANATIRYFDQPNDPRRVLVVTEVEHDGGLHRIVTTHFTWSPGGEFTDEQREDFGLLRNALTAYPHYVLCGDFNAPRGRPLFSLFTDEIGLIDHLPAHIRTTIDPQLHRAGALQLVVDTIFSTPDYDVEDVQVLDAVSDHKGILATLQRRPTLDGRP